MMKALLAVYVLVAGCFLVSGTLLDLLRIIHNAPSFAALSHPEQILIVELIAETESGELHDYIDEVGFANVLSVLDKLPQNDSHALIGYLLAELGKEEHNMTQTPAFVGRRDLAGVLAAARNDAAFKDLSHMDQELVIDVLTAAEAYNLTGYIKLHGYSTVLRLIYIIPEPEAHVFEQYLIEHLRQEAILHA